MEKFGQWDDRATAPNLPAEAPVSSVSLQPEGMIPSAARFSPADFDLMSAGDNRLLEMAMPLLGASIRLRGLHDYGAVEELHARLVNEMQVFERALENENYDAATVVAARYCMCAMVDEAALSRHWGADSFWTERPLLSVFHNETWGGEKFFAILDRVMAESHRFFDLLELMYYCLALGFEGRFHIVHNGRAGLDRLMDNVYRQLERHRDERPAKLTEPDVNIVHKKQDNSYRLPLWAIPVIGAGLLVIIHLGFDLSLDHEIDRIRGLVSAVLTKDEGGAL